MNEKEAIVETITALICGTAVVVLMVWFFVMVHRSNNCKSYEHLTGIRTTMLNWKCHKYVDGQLQVVKELD